MPKHVAVIMDGNGRWAKRRGQDRIYGHRRGIEATKTTVKDARRMGVSYLTLFALSTENLKRPRRELEALFNLLRGYIRQEIEQLVENGVRLRVIGRTELLPKDLQELIAGALAKSKNCRKMTLTIALCYGGRDEILRAAAKAMRLKKKSLDEKTFSALLDTAGMPDPDLLIRTGGELRISNFLLWQLAYTELYFTNTLWPDFSGKELRKAVKFYQTRERRFGLTSEQIEEKSQF